MKIVSIALLIFLSCVIFYAQDKKESSIAKTAESFQIYNDPCGNPAEESQRYSYCQGKIIKIISSNEVLFRQKTSYGKKDKQKFTVELVGIDGEQNKEQLIKFLTEKVLNHLARIEVNLRNKSDKKFGGELLLQDNDGDVGYLSEYLLENGIAKYKPFESANLVSMVIPCQLERAEATAKKAKLGIWAK